MLKVHYLVHGTMYGEKQHNAIYTRSKGDNIMVSLSELASQKIKQTLFKRGKGQGIKVGVRTTGCSGLAYTLEFVDAPSNIDTIYESNGIKIFVDPKHVPYMLGMEMDWKKQGLNEGFEFINPIEKSRCGCGESFNV